MGTVLILMCPHFPQCINWYTRKRSESDRGEFRSREGVRAENTRAQRKRLGCVEWSLAVVLHPLQASRVNHLQSTS